MTLKENPEVTHVAYLGDRWLYRPGVLDDIKAVVRSHSGDVVAYSWDTVDDFLKPVRLRLTPWSGEVLKIESERYLRLAANADVWHNSLPRMLNCFAPVAVLDQMRRRFGSVFGSVAPDFCFAYRCLALVDAVVYYDRPCMIDHSLNRSTGTNFHRSGSSPDLLDFLEFAGPKGLSYMAPIPNVSVAWNVAVHEYCSVRAEVGSDKFPPLDSTQYLRQLVVWVSQIPDAAERRRNFDRLRDAGWDGDMPELLQARASLSMKWGGRTGPLRAAVRGLLDRLYRVACHPVTKPIWLVTARLGLPPPGGQRFRFRSTDAALRYALKFPRRRRPSLSHIALVVDAPVS
jgi:hypothetical protein